MGTQTLKIAVQGCIAWEGSVRVVLFFGVSSQKCTESLGCDSGNSKDLTLSCLAEKKKFL